MKYLLMMQLNSVQDNVDTLKDKAKPSFGGDSCMIFLCCCFGELSLVCNGTDHGYLSNLE